MEWARDLAPGCPACRELYSWRTPPEDPPCDTCRVILAEENEDAAKIYMITQGQIVTMGENIIDINHLAVWEAIDRYNVRDPIRCFELVNKVFCRFMNKKEE